LAPGIHVKSPAGYRSLTLQAILIYFFGSKRSSNDIRVLDIAQHLVLRHWYITNGEYSWHGSYCCNDCRGFGKIKYKCIVFRVGKSDLYEASFGRHSGPDAGALLTMHLDQSGLGHAHEVIKVSCVVGSLCKCPHKTAFWKDFSSLCILGGFSLLSLRKLSSP
jgi:hypothetical protein